MVIRGYSVISNFMASAGCTRASFALSKNGRLVMSRGYTHHPASVTVTQPTNLFRVASISKSITAATVMELAEACRLNLDDKLGQFIDLERVTDRRWTNITDTPKLSIQQVTGDMPVLTIPTRGGRVYSIYAVSDLNQSWDSSRILAQLNGDGLPQVLQLKESEPVGFYRLRMSLRAQPVSRVSP